MSTWNIYHKDGSKLTDVNGEQITVHGLEYSDSWMGECFVTINFKHEVPINFQIGDYIVYRGERFELNYEPGKDKQARPDTYGEGFVYDSVKFNALQDELARAEFLDVVLNDNELHYTSLPKFPFFVQTLDDLLDRIQANLDEQIGAGLWKIYSRNKERSVQRGALESEWLSVYGEKTEDNVIESMSITVDSKKCWDALALVNEKWDVNFIVRGRNIYVGTTGIEAGHIFSYGLGKGLYEIVQNADSDQSVITRLRAYGSEKNLPSHYYADLGVKYVANITKVVTASTNVELELGLDYIETYFKNKRKYVVSGESQEQSNGWVLQVTFDFQTTITGYVTQSGSSGKCRFYSELKGGQVDSGDEESKEKLDAFISQVKAGNTKMYITSGLNKKAVPSSMKEYAKNLPNNMSINRLMLPGFPHVSLSDFYDSLTEQEKKYVNPTGKLHRFSTDPYRPYIDSLNIEEIGLRSASQFFDTDDKTNGVIEIYPTIEEMEIGGVRVDEIDEGVAPDDDGRFGDNETVKNIDILLNKAIDFDINDLKDDDFSISMKDGMCGGRTFKVASSTKVDGRWRLTIERSKDDALELWFPYKDYPIKSGDHFVLTGITLPDSYVKAASLKLLKYAIALLDKNDYTRYVYQPKVDELFMARQHDLAQADETGVIKSLHDTLKAGDLMNFNDTDLNIEGIISIDQLTIKEEDGKIPTYDITLREDKEVGTIQKIQQQISSLQNGNGGTGAGLTTTQVKNQVATEGSKHFISKINDDTAKGIITWEKIQKLLSGLLVGNFNNENGGSWTPDAEGRSHLITDYLEVRMKAIFEELVIKKTSTIGGKEIISPAGGVVAHKVEEVTVTYNNVSQKAYRCYFLAEQEGDAVDNDFSVNDQVRSESFNVRKGTYHKVGNHFYWRLVIGRDEDPVELEGKKYHYIDLSDTDCATASDVPAKGDVLSQCGNRTDVERQNCLIFSAVDTYSPSVSLYHGINSYSFANREYVEYGVNKQTNKAFFNVYGDMYVGDRPTKENNYEGSSYIKYDSATKQVSIKGKLSAKSTVDGKELSQYIKENSAKGLTEEQVNNLIKNSQVIVDLQNQVDGAIETWFYEGVPTLKNAPASSWTTDKDKDTHLGDLYYDNKTGKAYRFAKDGSIYKWTIITDTDIAKALSDASKAQETADGKMKVFSTQPNPPYQVGDIWVNATYPSDGSTYKNEVLRCQTNKAAGSQFVIGDWIKASKYTDDTVANAAKKAAEEAQKAAQTAQTNITNLGKTVTTNKKAFDNYVKDGYLEPSEIAAMAQDSKRLEDDFAAAQKSYNEVKDAEVLKGTKELTDLNTAFATLTTAKKELIKYLSDISARYNAADTNGKATIVSAVGTKFTNFQSAYSAFYDKLGLANAYITSKIYVNLGVVIGDVTSLAYLKKALMDAPDTEINGGLVLTSLIGLRDTDGNTTAGINGITEKSAKGGGVAAWFGGEMVDKDYNDGSKTPANTIFRFDGSGYVAGGAIWWGTDGRVHADPTSFIISEKNLGAYLTFFEPTWKAGSAGTSVADLVSLKPNAPFTKLGVSGDATFEGAISFHGIKLTYDATNKAIKVDGNLYATGGITAYGASSVAGGGGGLNGSVKAYADAIRLTTENLSEIASAYSVAKLYSEIQNVASAVPSISVSVPTGGNALTGATYDASTGVITFAKGTFLTAHQSLDGYVNAIAVSGSGNAVTAVTKSGKTITFTKGATYLTSHQSLSNYYTKSSVDSLLNGKSATTHTHSVKINGITKTIAASGGDAVDLGTYLTTHQSLAAYATQNWVKNEATAHNADMVDNYHASGLFTGFSISDVANKVTISIGGTSKALNLVRAFPSGVGNNFNDIATHGNSMGMSNIAAPYASSTANYQTLNGYVNPNGQTGWHHYINLSYTDSNNTATSPNMWQTQFAIKAGTTEVYVRSRAGGKISNSAAWDAPWVRLARVTDNVASASKVANALSWSGYSSGSYNGSAAKTISIPNNTNQLTNGAGFITASASISGNAGSATKLQNSRTINGTSFNGTANIVTSYWGTTRKLWGNSVNGNADVNGSITIANTDGVYVQIGDVRLVYDKANTAIKVVKSDGTTAANFYATGGITAYGEGSGSSGGGGLNGSVKSYADALKLASESLSEIASAYSIKALDSRISSLEGGSATAISVSGSGNAVTSVTKNGTTISVVKGSTFLTSHQSLDGYVNNITTSGTGNAITSVTKSGKTVTFTKGATFLTSHQSLSAYLKSADAANTYLKLSGGAMTGNISYKGSKNTYDMIRFVDNNVDIYGNGICIGGGGLTIIGGGESASEVLKQHTNGGDENMIVANDAAIDFFSNMNSGWDSRKAGSFDTSGYWNGVGFKKNNSNDNYVLTGGGGHKAISTLSVSYASSAGSANSVAWSNVSGRPTKVSQFTNDSNYATQSWVTGKGYLTSHQDISGKVNRTGDYLDTDSDRWWISNSEFGINLHNSDIVGVNSIYTSDVSNGPEESISFKRSNGNYDTLRMADGVIWFGTDYALNKTINEYQILHTNNIRITGKRNGFIDMSAGGVIKQAYIYAIGSIDGYESYPDGRTTSINDYDKGLNRLFLTHSTSSLPASQRPLGKDGHILHFGWDNSSGWDAQLAISANGDNPYIAIRAQYSGTWRNWYGAALLKCTNYISGNGGLIVERTDKNLDTYIGVSNGTYDIRLMIGSGNVNRGIYDVVRDNWMLYRDSSTNIYMNGSVLATGGITAYSSSDIRLKQDLRRLDYLGIIKAMGGTYGFAWKKDNTRSIGWIAQHVLCNTHLKDIVETDENGYYKINYWSPKLIATAFGAIEQVGDEVSRLKARVVFLESEVQRLSGKQDGNNKKRLDNKNINLLN